MLSGLTDKLQDVFGRLKKQRTVGPEDITKALRQVRLALLEADVALPAVKALMTEILEEALGQKVLKSVSPGQMVVKCVHDHLIRFLGDGDQALRISSKKPAVMMLVGLQGSGKTTSCAKLALHLKEKHHKKVLMASTDIYRPAAREQLAQLGGRIGIETLSILDEKVLDITKRALKEASLGGYDVLLLDTAGRLHIDEALMDEMAAIQKMTTPGEILYVGDALTGQDAVRAAGAFHEKISLTGAILTRLDGDARGGAALSLRYMTGCPLKFVGVGENPQDLQPFHADRMASRLLNMGDVVTLVEKAQDLFNEEESQRLEKNFQKGVFSLDDYVSQMEKMLKLGGVKGFMSYLPGMKDLKKAMSSKDMDDKIIHRQMAIVRSMTRKERKNPSIIKASHRRRIAQGSGTTVQDVNKLLKQHKDMGRMMKQFQKMGPGGLNRMGLGGRLGKPPRLK